MDALVPVRNLNKIIRMMNAFNHRCHRIMLANHLAQTGTA